MPAALRKNFDLPAGMKRSSLREAWIEVTKRKPWLVREAIERGLASKSPVTYLELGAKLMREIGAQESEKTQIAIVFNGPLDTSKLNPSTTTVKSFTVQEVKALPKSEEESK